MDGNEKRPTAVAFLTRMCEATDAADPALVLTLMQSAKRSLDGGAALPAPLYELAIAAALELGRGFAARAMLAEARHAHPKQQTTWDGLASRESARRAPSGRGAATPQPLREISKAISQADWPTAFAVAARARQNPAADPTEPLRLLVPLQDWAGVLREEAALIERLGLSGPAALPLPAALDCVTARARLGLSLQALVLAQQLAASKPEDAAIRAVVAQSLAQSGDQAGALAIRKAQWDAGDDAAMLPMALGLIGLGDHAGCGRFLDSITAAGRTVRPGAIQRARARLQEATGDVAGALATTLTLEGVMPEIEYASAVARQARAARDRDKLQALLGSLDSAAADPARRPYLLRAGPQILAEHYDCLADHAAIGPLLNRLSEEVLAPDGAAVLAALHSRNDDHRSALAVVQRCLAMFPSALALWRRLFTTLGALRDKPGLVEARRRMREVLPREVALNLLIGAEAKAWDLAELPEMIEHALLNADRQAQAGFFTSLRRLRLPAPRMERALQTVAAWVSPLAAIQLDYVMRQSSDRNGLEDAVLTEIPQAEFVAGRDATAKRVLAALRRVTGDKDTSLDAAQNNWLRDCTGYHGRIQSRAGADLRQTADSFADAARLAAELLQRIRAGKPCSAIRLDDGDGHLLPSPRPLAALAKADLADMQNEWWGAQRPAPGQVDEMTAALRGAIDRADILGVVPIGRLVASLDREGGLGQLHRSMQRQLAWLAGAPARLAVSTSADFHQDLDSWGLWRDILAEVTSVSWIATQDLAPCLWDVRGIATRQGILVPPGRDKAVFFGAETADPQELALDRHPAICAQLDPKPGEVWLVSAGILGKIYCDLIRTRGGIGIDIGSLADDWVRFAKRENRFDNGAELGLEASLITGHGLEHPTDRARILGRPDILRSSKDGRFNIGTEADRAALATTSRDRRLLRVIGHPRCASGFMATLFAAHGIEIGHERMLADGVAGWMYLVADQQAPNAENAAASTDFERTVLHLRDPAQAIPAIMLENGMARSFAFRRQHILRQTGEDIARYRTALDRAVASYLHWYAMGLALKPDAVLKVETAEAGIAAPLAAWRGAAVPPLAGRAKESVAAAAWRLDQPTPSLVGTEWRLLDPGLARGLAEFCSRFGYDTP